MMTRPGGWRRLDAVLALSLSLIAAALRWPYLILVPRMTDEWEDVQFALGLTGAPWQLVSNDAYNGPLFHWLLAGLLSLTRSPLAPRFLVMVLGALTVGLTYGLGASLSAWRRQRRQQREMRAHAIAEAPTPLGDLGISVEDRVAGLLAASLMAVAFIPIVVNSHIAWSNSTTPFWTSLFLLALVEAVRRDRPRWLLAAGLLAGLAQQTHPSVIALLLGAAAWSVGMRPRWLRRPWPWLAALIALAVVSNLLVYNLMTHGGSARMAETRDYAYTGGAGGAEYLTNLGRTARLGYQMVGSSFRSEISEESDPAALRAVLTAPGALLYGGVAVAALALGLAGGGWLPLACWLVALLLLPFFNRGWHHYILARYLADLLPPTFAAMGMALARLIPPGADRAGRRGIGRWLVLLALTSLLWIHPLLALQRYYARELELGRHNRRVLQTFHMLEAVSARGAPVALDRELRFLHLTAGGNLLNVLDGMLDLHGLPHAKLSAEEQAALEPGTFIVLSHAQRDALAGELELAATEPEPYFAPAAPGDYNLYRVVGPR